MGVWRIDVDVLARSRFTVSPMADTVAALAVLAGTQPVPALRDWADLHRQGFRKRVAGDRVLSAFLATALRPNWTAHVLALPPPPNSHTFDDEIRQLRALPAEIARRDLSIDTALPADLTVPDLVSRIADLLEWVWTETLSNGWPRRRRLYEADIVARGQRLAAAGWAAALNGMRPGMRWLGESLLQISTYDNPAREITGDADLTLIPSSSRRGWTGWDEPSRYVIVYPCAGLLTPRWSPPDGALEALLGPRRARILSDLTGPRSTSQIAATTGYGLGSVGGHLKILLEAGLVTRKRSGRIVLYSRSRLGEDLTRGHLRAATGLGARQPAPRPV